MRIFLLSMFSGCSLSLSTLLLATTSDATDSEQNKETPLISQQSSISADTAPSSKKKREHFWALPNCNKGVKQQRVTLKQREGHGIGYQSSYTTLEGFFSRSFTPFAHLFLDVRGHHFNDGKWAANAGGGIRLLPEAIEAVFGANIYYDYRQMGTSSFNQIGGGIEILGTKWDFRLNGYFPSKKEITQTKFSGFKDHRALFRKDYELSLMGGDVEVGRKLFTSTYFDLHGLLGGYYFSGKFDKNATGGLARISARITPYISISGQASYDSLFKDTYQGELALNFPFGNSKKSKKELPSCRKETALFERLSEEVSRFEIIVTDDHRKKTSALDPTTGLPLFFVFVDNERGSSDGSFENPYPTLNEAETYSSPGNVIYVFQGDGTSNGMNAGISLQDDQWLIGSGVPLAVNTSFGEEIIPSQTQGYPSLSNTTDTVVLANNNTINGFFITATTGDSIHGNGIDSTLIRNIISDATEVDIHINQFSGNLLIENNLLTGQQNGISLGTDFDHTLVIQNNQILNSPSNIGINIIVADNAVSSVDILNNEWQGIAAGILFVSEDTSVVNINLTGNTGSNITILDFMAVHSQDASTLNAIIKDNSCDTITGNGYAFYTEHTSTASFNIISNTVTNSQDTGIGVETFDTSAITSRLIGNTSPGIIVSPAGFVLINAGGSTLSLQSPNGDLSGVEAINTGTFDTSGVITIIPFEP